VRPTTQPQSGIRAPLNDIFGTEANVRIMRALSSSPAPISAAELARQAQLQRSSVHRALKTLTDLGIVSPTGPAPHRQVSLAESSPLAQPIRALFTAEQSRYDKLFASLQRASTRVEPPPISVWVEGTVARGVDRPGEAVIVCALGNARDIDHSAEALREALQSVERQLDVTIEVRSRTLADLEAKSGNLENQLKDAIPVFGIPPMGLLKRYRGEWEKRNIRAHGDHDARSLTLGKRIADRLAHDPSLVARARARLHDRWSKASARERKELDEWRRILDTATPARLRKILSDPGERGTRLRQTLPFLGIVPEEDRNGDQ
jgi:IclR-like helix-turn-helix domain-containing protein